MKKYLAISKDIREKIFNKVYKQGMRLPYEYELCEEYKCNKQTMKKSLEILVNEGLIIRRRGAGTFVKDTINTSGTPELTYGHYIKGFTKHFHSIGEIKTKVLQFKVIPAAQEEADRLKIKKDDFIYCIERVRIVNNVPHVIELIYMPISIITNLRQEDVEGSIYTYIEEELNKKIHGSNQLIKAFPSTEHDQKNLGLSEYEPVVEVEKTAYLTSGIPFEYSKLRFHYKHFSFYAVVNKLEEIY